MPREPPDFQKTAHALIRVLTGRPVDDSCDHCRLSLALTVRALEEAYEAGVSAPPLTSADDALAGTYERVFSDLNRG